MPYLTPRENDRLGADADAADDAVDGGLWRVLIAVYIILAIAATCRSIYQILTKFDEAPLSYALSALSGAVYIVATVALIKRRGAWRGVAWAALVFELVGVLTVGTLSLTHPEIFGHDTVWSLYGSGYCWVPLVLPVLGMLWLRREGREAPGDPALPAPDPNASLY